MTLCFFISPQFFLRNRRKMGIFGWFLPQKWSRFFTFEKAIFIHFFGKNLYNKKVAAQSVPNYPPFKTVQKMSEKPPFRSITVQ